LVKYINIPAAGWENKAQYRQQLATVMLIKLTLL